ncbi:hypothetical protein HKD37_06G016904 [Glycine soja]
MPCTKKSSQMTSEAAKDCLTGKLVTYGHQDVLIAAIGRPEHPGHIRAVRANMQSQGLALPTEPEVGLFTTRVRTKESCIDPSGNDLDTIKVGDEEVRDVDVCILVPTQEVQLVGASEGFNDSLQTKSKVVARWIVVKYFNDVRPLEPKRMKVFCIKWATYYLKVKNETIS